MNAPGQAEDDHFLAGAERRDVHRGGGIGQFCRRRSRFDSTRVPAGERVTNLMVMGVSFQEMTKDEGRMTIRRNRNGIRRPVNRHGALRPNQRKS